MKYNFLFILLLFFSFKSFCTHIKGGEITITKTSTSGYTCQITLRAYVNWISPIKFGGGTLDFGDGTNITTQENPYTQTVDPFVGIYLYTVNHTYPGPGRYRVTYSEQNLDAGIINMSYSVETPFFLASDFMLDPLQKSSIITFASNPIFKAALGFPYSFSTAPVDTLNYVYNYELVAPEQASGVSVTDYVFPENLKLNSQSGLLTWDTKFHDQFLQGEYLFAIRVNQFDVKGNYHGSTERVFTIQMLEMPTKFSISNPVNDSIGKVTVLTGDVKKIKLILADSINSDSLFWTPYFDPSLISNVSFDQHDSVSSARKFKIGLLTVSTTNAIVRALPYTIILRGISLDPVAVISKDVSFFFFTNEVDLPVVTGVVESDNRISAYPNPCTNEVYFTGTHDSAQVLTINTLGQTIGISTLDEENKMDTSQLPTGIYFLILNGNQRRAVIKLMKK